MDRENTSVIDEDKHWKSRSFKESIHSALSGPCINKYDRVSIKYYDRVSIKYYDSVSIKFHTDF